jgi:DNA-binding transcriptional ArsR family regulator
MSSYTIDFNTGKENSEPVTLDTLLVKKSAIHVRALNHKLRQQIMKKIDEKGSCTVTEIFTELFLAQAVASQQLAILRKAGFVKNIYYSLNIPRLKEFLKTLEQLNR